MKKTLFALSAVLAALLVSAPAEAHDGHMPYIPQPIFTVKTYSYNPAPVYYYAPQRVYVPQRVIYIKPRHYGHTKQHVKHRPKHQHHKHHNHGKR